MSIASHAETLKRLLPPVSYAIAGEQLQAELNSAAALLDGGMETVDLLRRELDPSLTYDLLDEWEAAYGLPDVCAEESQTIAERRLALIAKLREVGGQTAAYYERIAVALGYTDARVSEYRVATCESDCVVPLASAGWRNVWSISTAAAQRVTYLDCTGACTEPLANWGALEVLTCVMNRLKPAHTLCYIDMGEG